jgi:hypothetical protein
VNDSTFATIADTWEGSATTWRPITGPDVAPRDHQSLVVDENRQALLMFGGIPGDRAPTWPSDTWALREQGWERIATDGPAGRGRTALAYDAARKQVVLFGGVGAPPGERQEQPFFSDTWVLDRSGWCKVADSGPRGRYAHGMAFDERTGVILLYSGAAAHRNAPLTDMWQWDGSRWTEIRLTGPTPGYRYQPVMVYDRARGRTVLYGGSPTSVDDTWEWDGHQWKDIRPCRPIESAIAAESLYDRRQHGVRDAFPLLRLDDRSERRAIRRDAIRRDTVIEQEEHVIPPPQLRRDHRRRPFRAI